MPNALEKVRSTTRREVCRSSGTAVGPPNSWYASSQTTIAPVSLDHALHGALGGAPSPWDCWGS